jgi:hypothetical protein
MPQQLGQAVFLLAFALFWLVAAHWMLEWRDEHWEDWHR